LNTADCVTKEKAKGWTTEVSCFNYRQLPVFLALSEAV